MIRKNKWFRLSGLFLIMAVFSAMAGMPALPDAAVRNVLNKGFPTQPAALASTTESLFHEYKNTGNIISLVFYSYGMLRQANYFLTVSDIIKASEYAKTGFFYLDEAVDLNEDKLLIRYLRSRIDAYLPADLGRCVITIEDTELLLNEKEKLGRGLTEHLNNMRYRALYNCKKYEQMSQFLAQLKERGEHVEISVDNNDSPSWDIDEVTRIILPLINGD